MTSRLLRASLGAPTYDDMRATLRAQAAATVVETRGVRVRAACLPVFHRAGGALRQLVRVHVDPAMPERTIQIRDGTDVRAAAPAAGTVDLFVPEVDEPRELTMELTGIATGRMVIRPQRKWTVHVVHHSHLDIGYTDRQGVVLRNHLEYLDSALDLAAATDDWPDHARFRWTAESALPVHRWLAARPPAAVARFVELAKAGRVEVTAMPFQLHTEACSTDELHRLVRLTDRLRAEHGIPVTSAMHTDVPGAVVGLVDALAATGVHYLSAAHNWAGRSVPFLVGGQELSRPFWWRSPAGNRVLVWFTDTPHGMAYMEGNVVGLAQDFDTTLELLPGYLDSLANEPFPYGAEAYGWFGMPADQVTRRPYPHDLLHLRVQGGDADNAGPSIVPPAVILQWNETFEYPALLMSTNTGFFVEAEQRLGDRLQEFTGDWTDWWADGLGSGSRPLGFARRAQHAVRHAETLHSLAGDDASVAVAAVYDKLGLFDEHTWGAANPWHDAEDGFDSGGLQWARKCEFAYQGADDAEDLRHAGARRLGAGYARPPGSLAAYLVVNPGPARDDVAEVFLPASAAGLDEPVRVVDARTGRRVPHHEEVIRPTDWPTRPAGRRLAFIATGVPGLGCVRFDIMPGDGPRPVEALTGTTIESDSYRVSFDPRTGVLDAIHDKRAGRELVNPTAYGGMNQYVYDRYSTAPHVNHLSGHMEASATTALLASRTVGRRARVERVVRTAVGETLEASADGDGVDWLRTIVHLPAGGRQVRITNRILKQGAPAKESVFFAFPFAMPAPAAWELTGGVGGTGVPTVPGAARHMQPIRHWVAFNDGEFGVGWATLEAPLVMFGDLYLPYAPFPPTLAPEPAEPGTVYSWALNNIWDTNFPAQQQGETTFRYAITSDSGVEPRVLGPRAAAPLTDPFLAVPVTGASNAATAEQVFAAVDESHVHVTSLARSPDGGLIATLRSMADRAVDTTLRLPTQNRSIPVHVPPCGFVEVRCG